MAPDKYLAHEMEKTASSSLADTKTVLRAMQCSDLPKRLTVTSKATFKSCSENLRNLTSGRIEGTMHFV